MIIEIAIISFTGFFFRKTYVGHFEFLGNYIQREREIEREKERERETILLKCHMHYKS